MNIDTPTREHVFPLSAGSFERMPLRAPRLNVNAWSVSGNVLGHRAFMRAWAARRAARAASAESAALALTESQPGAGPPEAAISL